MSLVLCFASASPISAQRFVRKYNATAYVNLLSLTIFSRSGVGFASAGAAEDSNGDIRIVTLRFLSGSIPERAHGLNRFGFIQESVRERNHKCVQADYFGLMTTNGEESLAQAKSALNSQSGEKMPFVAAEAFINGDSARYSVRHMLLPSSYRGSNADQLLREVEASFSVPGAGQQEKRETLHGGTIGLFLYSLREAMLAGGDSFESRFVYNGKTFRLKAEKHHDERAGNDLRKLRIVSSGAVITQLSATIRNELTHETTNFRLWFDSSSANVLPLRFEYRPKPYLKLVFDAVPDPGTVEHALLAPGSAQ